MSLLSSSTSFRWSKLCLADQITLDTHVLILILYPISCVKYCNSGYKLSQLNLTAVQEIKFEFSKLWHSSEWSIIYLQWFYLFAFFKELCGSLPNILVIKAAKSAIIDEILNITDIPCVSAIPPHILPPTIPPNPQTIPLYKACPLARITNSGALAERQQSEKSHSDH